MKTLIQEFENLKIAKPKYKHEKFVNVGIQACINKVTQLEQKPETDTKLQYCPSCQKDTVQKSTLYDPDEPDGLIVWECTKCHEVIAFKTQ